MRKRCIYAKDDFKIVSLKVDINKKEGLQKYDKIHFRKEVYFYYGNKRAKV